MKSTALGISIGLTAVVLIQERKEGLMDRTWVAGVNVTEVIISQVITQFFILLVQIVLMLVFVLWVFKVCELHPSRLGGAFNTNTQPLSDQTRYLNLILLLIQIYNKAAANIPLLMVLALLQGMTGIHCRHLLQ